jgi:hypothetical protein
MKIPSGVRKVPGNLGIITEKKTKNKIKHKKIDKLLR